MLTYILAIIANAFGRRFAGGLLGQWFGNIGGTQVARLAQAAIAGGTVALLAPVWWWGLVALAATWAGATFGFGRAGMIPRGLGDVIDLAVFHGAVSVLPLAVVLVALDLVTNGPLVVGSKAAWIVLAGLARGPIYWLATLWQPHVPFLGLNRDGLPDPPAWAEFWAGGALGAALVLALH